MSVHSPGEDHVVFLVDQSDCQGVVDPAGNVQERDTMEALHFAWDPVFGGTASAVRSKEFYKSVSKCRPAMRELLT